MFILKTAYGKLVDRVGDIKAPRGSKTEMILPAIERLPREFTVMQLEKACPCVSREMVRRVLGSQKGKRMNVSAAGPVLAGVDELVSIPDEVRKRAVG